MKASFRKQNQNDEEDSNGLARGEERVVQAESTKINRGIKQDSNPIHSNTNVLISKGITKVGKLMRTDLWKFILPQKD